MKRHEHRQFKHRGARPSAQQHVLVGQQKLDAMVRRDAGKIGALGCGCREVAFVAYFEDDNKVIATCSDNETVAAMLQRHDPSLYHPFVLASTVATIGPWTQTILAYLYEQASNKVFSGLFTIPTIDKKVKA